MTNLITTTTNMASKRKALVQLYNIRNGDVKPLQQENATNTDFWRTITLRDHLYYNYECRDFRVLSIKLEDVEHMIEMCEYSLTTAINLLQSWNVFRDNRTPDLRYLMFKYFHLIPNGKPNTGYHEMASYNDIYVSFYGLRLISDMIYEQSIGGNIELLLEELYQRDIKAGKSEEFYFLEDQTR